MNGPMQGAARDTNRGITNGLDSIDKQVGILAEELDGLFKQLAPATLDVPCPTCCGTEAKNVAMPPLCETARRLMEVDGRLVGLRDMVRRQKETLDL